MKDLPLKPGEAWLVETLREVGSRRGWTMISVNLAPELSGVFTSCYRIALVDRYGREYRYQLLMTVDDSGT